MAPNLLRSCRNLGLWLPELCSIIKVLNPETVSATDLFYVSLLYSYCDYRMMCFEIYLLIFNKHYNILFLDFAFT